MKKENLNEYVNKMSEVLDEKFKIITSIEYHYDLEQLMSFMKNLSDTEFENVLENLINDKLEEIKKFGNEDLLQKNNKSVDEVTEFFYDNENEEDAVCAEEGSCLATDLILKVFGRNGRKISLPINIGYIKDYCISNVVEEKDLRKTLMWVALELSTVSYFLKNK